MTKISSLFKSPLASIQWLIYLVFIFVILSLYVVCLFYYHYGDDIFSKSITPGQYIKLSVYSIGSMLSELIIPLLFFSGALVYRSVRTKNINLLSALKRDLLIIILLGITLWIYGAYIEQPMKSKFYAMIYNVQNLKPGEKLVQDSNTYKLMESDNLSGLHKKIVDLDVQIIDFEKLFLKNGSPSNSRFIKELQKEQQKYQDEIMVIHFTPFYILLFFVLGLLLGYLIPLHKMALTAILIAVAFTWFYGTSVLEAAYGFRYSNMYLYLLGKIVILLLVTLTLIILSIKTAKRSKAINL